MTCFVRNTLRKWRVWRPKRERSEVSEGAEKPGNTGLLLAGGLGFEPRLAESEFAEENCIPKYFFQSGAESSPNSSMRWPGFTK